MTHINGNSYHPKTVTYCHIQNWSCYRSQYFETSLLWYNWIRKSCMHIISFSTPIAKHEWKTVGQCSRNPNRFYFVRLFSRVASHRTSRSSSTVRHLQVIIFNANTSDCQRGCSSEKSRGYLEGSLKVTFRIWRINSKVLYTNLINSNCEPKHTK